MKEVLRGTVASAGAEEGFRRFLFFEILRIIGGG
jgi:hypothetical protein